MLDPATQSSFLQSVESLPEMLASIGLMESKSSPGTIEPNPEGVAEMLDALGLHSSHASVSAEPKVVPPSFDQLFEQSRAPEEQQLMAELRAENATLAERTFDQLLQQRDDMPRNYADPMPLPDLMPKPSMEDSRLSQTKSIESILSQMR